MPVLTGWNHAMRSSLRHVHARQPAKQLLVAGRAQRSSDERERRNKVRVRARSILRLAANAARTVSGMQQVVAQKQEEIRRLRQDAAANGDAVDVTALENQVQQLVKIKKQEILAAASITPPAPPPVWRK